MSRVLFTTLAITLALQLPARADHFFVKHAPGHCYIKSKDSTGTHHELHKVYYSYDRAVAAMKKDKYCHKKG